MIGSKKGMEEIYYHVSSHSLLDHIFFCNVLLSASIGTPPRMDTDGLDTSDHSSNRLVFLGVTLFLFAVCTQM